MVYQKREELEAELNNIHKRELSSEPHVKKGYKWRNHLFYTPEYTVEDEITQSKLYTSSEMTEMGMSIRFFLLRFFNKCR
jgi:hypothetical protein